MGRYSYVPFLFLLALGACEKKDRLTASTFQFSIVPPAKAVVFDPLKPQDQQATQTFRIATSIGGTPTWTVEHSTVGTLNTTVGPVVVFTPAAFGDTHILATLGGVTTIAQVTAVSSYSPGVTVVFDIYSDKGIPKGTGIDSDLYVSPDNKNIFTVVEDKSGTEWTPEGVNYQRTTIIASNLSSAWGVDLDFHNHGFRVNKSSFAGKSLKFYLRLHRALNGGESITIKLESQPGDVKSPLPLVSGFYGYDSSNTTWQEISIPLSDFGGFDLSSVKVPFAIVLNNSTNPLPLIFDVDGVRWE